MEFATTPAVMFVWLPFLLELLFRLYRLRVCPPELATVKETVRLSTPASTFRLLDLPNELITLVLKYHFETVKIQHRRPRTLADDHPRSLLNGDRATSTACFLVNRRTNAISRLIWWQSIMLGVPDISALNNEGYWRTQGGMVPLPNRYRYVNYPPQDTYRMGRRQIRNLELPSYVLWFWSFQSFHNLETLTVSPMRVILRHKTPTTAGAPNLLESWCSTIGMLKLRGAGRNLERPEVVDINDDSYPVRVHLFHKTFFFTMLMQCWLEYLGYPENISYIPVAGDGETGTWLPTTMRLLFSKSINGVHEFGQSPTGVMGLRKLMTETRATDRQFHTIIRVTTCEENRADREIGTIADFGWDVRNQCIFDQRPPLAIHSSDRPYLNDPVWVERDTWQD